MWKQFFRILIKIILFIIIPVFMCVLFIEFIVIGYREEILLFSDLLDTISNFNLWLIGVCIISLGGLLIIFRVMKTRLFIISGIFWGIVLAILFSIYSQPIPGLIDIPDSVFVFSGIDINHIPKLKPELCSEIKNLTNNLTGNPQILFRGGSDNQNWKQLRAQNPEKSEYIEYLILLDEKMNLVLRYQNDFLSAVSLNDKWLVNSGNITKKTLSSRFPKEKQVEYIQVTNDLEEKSFKILNDWDQYRSLHTGSLISQELISLIYTRDDLKKIERLQEIIEGIKSSQFGFCIQENPQNLADELIPITSPDFNLERILLQYAIVEASIGDTKKADYILNTVLDYIAIQEKHIYTLVGAMTNIAMKGIFYRTIDMLKYIGYSEELLDGIYSKIRIFDDDTMMINAYKGEHYLFSHLYMSTDTFLQKLYIPLLLDGEESIKIAKNYYSFYMQMIDTSLPNGKYSNNDIDNPFANKDIFENTDYDSYTIHNIFGKYLLRSFIPSLNSYYKRFLFSEIEKNTILYPIIY